MVNNVTCGPLGGKVQCLIWPLQLLPLSWRPCQCSSPSGARRKAAGDQPPAWLSHPVMASPPRNSERPSPHYPSTPRQTHPNMSRAMARACTEALRPASFLSQLSAPIYTPKGFWVWTSFLHVQLLPMPNHQPPHVHCPFSLCAA